MIFFLLTSSCRTFFHSWWTSMPNYRILCWFSSEILTAVRNFWKIFLVGFLDSRSCFSHKSSFCSWDLAYFTSFIFRSSSNLTYFIKVMYSLWFNSIIFSRIWFEMNFWNSIRLLRSIFWSWSNCFIEWKNYGWFFTYIPVNCLASFLYSVKVFLCYSLVCCYLIGISV